MRIYVYIHVCARARACVYIRIYLYTAEQRHTVGGKMDTHVRKKKDIHIHTRHTLHGWPTNLRFYSSSQLFGWLNCYKGTLLRSTVFARYILVHFVYGLWLTRLIRFAMFFLVAWPYPAVLESANERTNENEPLYRNWAKETRKGRGGGGGRSRKKKFVRSYAPTRFPSFPSARFYRSPSIRFIERIHNESRDERKQRNGAPTFLDSKE